MSFNQLDKPLEGEVTAVMHTTMGDISIRLFKAKVPRTVNNFVELAKKYDAIVSDPDTTRQIKDELASCSVDNFNKNMSFMR